MEPLICTASLQVETVFQSGIFNLPKKVIDVVIPQALNYGNPIKVSSPN